MSVDMAHDSTAQLGSSPIAAVGHGRGTSSGAVTDLSQRRRAARIAHRRFTWLPSGSNPSAPDPSAFDSSASDSSASDSSGSDSSTSERRSGERMLSVRVDEPDGRIARGAVVIAGSFDREAVVSFRTTRALAAAARDAGFVAYTFAWSGDGDSFALEASEDPATAWVQDLTAVTGHARSLVGPQAPVHVVGLRLGASILAATPRSGPGRRLYWEPVTGAAFVRNHSLIRRSSVPVPLADEGVELDGALLTPAQVAGIRTLKAPTRAQLETTGLDGADGEGTPADVLRKEADPRAGMRLALGAPYFSHVPLTSIEEVLAQLPVGEPVVLPRWSVEPTATLRARDPRGEQVTVTETLVEVGPQRLPAIRTQSFDVPSRAAVLFTAMGSEVKAGPGSFWSTAARTLAADGVVSLRADRSEIGDDADPALAPEPRPYVESAVTSIAAASAELAREGLPIIGVGVCAGAWAMLRATGAGHAAQLREILGVNVVHWAPDPGVYTEAFYAHYHGQESAERAGAADSADSTDGSEGSDDEQETDAPRARRSPRERLQTLGDTLSTELAIRYPRLRSALRHDVPLDLAEPLLRQVPRRVGLTLLYGTHDHRIFVGKGGRRSVRRAQKRGMSIGVINDPTIDHSLFAHRGQQATLALLRTRIDAVTGLDRGQASS